MKTVLASILSWQWFSHQYNVCWCLFCSIKLFSFFLSLLKIFHISASLCIRMAFIMMFPHCARCVPPYSPPLLLQSLANFTPLPNPSPSVFISKFCQIRSPSLTIGKLRKLLRSIEPLHGSSSSMSLDPFLEFLWCIQLSPGNSCTSTDNAGTFVCMRGRVGWVTPATNGRTVQRHQTIVDL